MIETVNHWSTLFQSQLIFKLFVLKYYVLSTMKKKIHEPLLSTTEGKTNSLQKKLFIYFCDWFFDVDSLFLAVNVTFKNPIFFEEEEIIER